MMSSPEKMNGAELSKKLSSLSPAERVEMLKLRFAGLIAKANNNNNSPQQQTKVINPLSQVQEANCKKRKRQETQQDELMKIGVGVGVGGGKQEKEEEFEEKKRRKLIVDRKKQEIEAKRKAFRLELEKLERSVEVVDNYKVTRDFEKLINAKPTPYKES